MVHYPSSESQFVRWLCFDHCCVIERIVVETGEVEGVAVGVGVAVDANIVCQETGALFLLPGFHAEEWVVSACGDLRSLN